MVDSAWTNCGASAEIVARLSDDDRTSVKTSRLGFAPTTCPTTRCLEDLFYPNVRSIAVHVNHLLRGDESWTPAEMEFGDEIEFKGPF